MVDFDHLGDVDDVWALTERVEALRDLATREARAMLQTFGPEAASLPEIVNLAHYLALRNHNLHALQRALTRHGLSSLGPIESRVLPTLDAVLVALSALAGRESAVPRPSAEVFFAGEQRLAQATDRMFGPAPAHRRCRIMVTLGPEAADDPALVSDLARYGMDIARINRADGGSKAWQKMAQHVQQAGVSVGRRITLLMDIAAPEIRIENVTLAEKKLKAHVGDRIRLIAAGEPSLFDDIRFCASVSLSEMVTRLKVGDRVFYDDGKLQAVVTDVSDGMATIRVEHTKDKGARLKPEKNLCLPDTALGLQSLMNKGGSEISTVIECADMIGYDFVSHSDDLDCLDQELGAGVRASYALGVVAKVERQDAVRNLPGLIARAAGRRDFAVMIGPGEAASLSSVERQVEMQQDILSLCKAASVPVIWAVQGMERSIDKASFLHGDVGNGAMGVQAQCLMLNAGENIGEDIAKLDSLLARMDAELTTKR